MDNPKKGDAVTWNYSKSKVKGIVDEVHNEDIEKTVQGTTVKRKGSSEEPALVIKQGKKSIVKSASEVEKQNK